MAPTTSVHPSACARVCVSVCVWQEGFNGISSSEEDTDVHAHAQPHTVAIDPAVGRRLLHQSARTHPGVFYCSAAH